MDNGFIVFIMLVVLFFSGIFVAQCSVANGFNDRARQKCSELCRSATGPSHKNRFDQATYVCTCAGGPIYKLHDKVDAYKLESFKVK